MLLVVFATLVLRITPLMRNSLPINPVGDNIGAYLGAARLAGLDWSDLGSRVSYFGQGYYVLFAPVFMLTDNPFTIHLSFILTNALLLSAFSTVIYTIAVLYCRLPDKFHTAFIVAVCSSSLFSPSNNPRNENPLFFIVWLTTLMLLISINSPRKGKNIATVGLIAVSFWGMFVHTRLEVLIILICLVTLLYYLLYKVWIISPHIFYPAIIALYFLAGRIHLHLADILYGGRDFSQMTNATLSADRVLRRSFSPEAFFDTIISNTTTLIVNQYGLAAITIILFAYLIFKMFNRFFIKRIRNDEELGLPRDQLAIVLIFAGCIIATIAGIYLRWGGQIHVFYTGAGGRFRWMTYARYYTPFYSPLLLITAGYAYNNTIKAAKMCIGAIGLFLILYIYVAIKIMPWQLRRIDTGGNNLSLTSFDGSQLDTYGTAVLILGFLAVFYFLLSHRKPQLLLIPVYAFILSISVSNISTPFFNIVSPSNRVDTTYMVLKHIETTVGLPDHIHVSTDRNALQFMLNRYRIVQGIQGIPSGYDYIGIYVGPPTSANSYMLGNLGFVSYVFPNNAGIWVRGYDIRESLRLRGIDYNLQHNVIHPQISNLIESSDATNIYLKDIDNVWVYQSIFTNNIINRFDYNLDLFVYDMGNNIIISRNNNVFAFSDEIRLGDYWIVTNDRRAIDAAISMGGERFAFHRHITLMSHREFIWYNRITNSYIWTNWPQQTLIGDGGYGFSQIHSAVWMILGDSVSENIIVYNVNSRRFVVPVIEENLQGRSFSFVLQEEEMIETPTFHIIDVDSQSWQEISMELMLPRLPSNWREWTQILPPTQDAVGYMAGYSAVWATLDEIDKKDAEVYIESTRRVIAPHFSQVFENTIIFYLDADEMNQGLIFYIIDVVNEKYMRVDFELAE